MCKERPPVKTWAELFLIAGTTKKMCLLVSKCDYQQMRRFYKRGTFTQRESAYYKNK